MAVKAPIRCTLSGAQLMVGTASGNLLQVPYAFLTTVFWVRVAVCRHERPPKEPDLRRAENAEAT